MAYVKGMVVQTSGSKPHVRYMMVALAMNFPTIIWKMGGKVDRLTRDGHVSAHSSGRAIDIYLEAKNQPDKDLGDQLFSMFINNAAALKVEHIIWNWDEWSPANGGTYGRVGPKEKRGPHTDHVHVAFKDDHLDERPKVSLAPLFANIKRQMRAHGYADWLNGRYGTAFDPKHPLKRLSRDARYDIRYQKDFDEGLTATRYVSMRLPEEKKPRRKKH